nr:hypothetical protein [Paenibacillus xylanexedens]
MKSEKIKGIERKEDAVIFLNQLIILTYKRMQRLKDCIKDLEEEIEKFKGDDTKVPTKIYHKHSERAESLTNYLFNLFGDETKTAVSYKQFRNVIHKKSKQDNSIFLLDELEYEIVDLLNEFRDMRNWAHHVPQSLLNTQIDYMENVAGLPSKLVEYQFSQKEVYVLTWDYHEIEWLFELHEGLIIQYEKFTKVFQRMKKDYSKLVGASIEIIKEKQKIPRPKDFKQIGENSYKINTGKNKSKGIE